MNTNNDYYLNEFGALIFNKKSELKEATIMIELLVARVESLEKRCSLLEGTLPVCKPTVEA